eukprot:3477421-Pyramimonas_sp.AAC.1
MGEAGQVSVEQGIAVAEASEQELLQELEAMQEEECVRSAGDLYFATQYQDALAHRAAFSGCAEYCKGAVVSVIIEDEGAGCDAP